MPDRADPLGAAAPPSTERGFFPLPLGDGLFIVSLVVLAVVAFLPWGRAAVWGGVALSGWLLAALMVLSPVIALIRIAREGRRRARSHAEEAPP